MPKKLLSISAILLAATTAFAVEYTISTLEEFLAEDPYGNIAKIDKFYTYLENNGPAAFHVADGKNVDLNWIYREVIG